MESEQQHNGFKEYKGNSNERIDIREVYERLKGNGKKIAEVELYCAHSDCANYIKGRLNLEYFLFECESGNTMGPDQVWYCHKHNC